MLDAAAQLLRRDLFRKSATVLALRVVGTASGFLLSLLITRYLPADQAGLFFLGLTLITLMATVGMLGLNQSLLRFIGADFAENQWPAIRAVARKANLWAGLLLISFCLILYFAAPYLAHTLFDKPALAPVLRSLSPSIVFVGLSILIAHQLQAIQQTQQSVIISSIAIPLTVGVGLVILRPKSVSLATGVYTLASLLTLMLAFLWWRRSCPAQQTGSFDSQRLWASCFPIAVMILAEETVRWSGQIAAGIWISADEYAALAVAQRVANLIKLVSIAVNLVIAPQFAALYQQNKLPELRLLALRATRMMSFCALPLVLLLLICPEWIMSWFGDDYRQGATALIILSIGQFVGVVSGSVTYLLTMSGHEKDMRNVVLLSCPIAICSAFLLTPALGVTGAAIATTLAVISQNLLAVRMVKHRLGFNTLAMWRMH